MEKQESSSSSELANNDTNNQNQVTFQPIPGVQNLYHVTIPVGSAPAEGGGGGGSTNNARFAVVFILDRSGSMSSTFRSLLLPACAQFLDETKPDQPIVVFFDSTTDCIENGSAQWFRSTDYNVRGSTRIDLGVEKAVTLAVAHQAQHLGQNWTYQFVLMTDGGNDFSGDKLKSAIMACRPTLLAANLNSIVSVINIGSSADTQAGMWTKEALQTMNVQTQSVLLVAQSTTDLPQVVASLSSETQLIRQGRSCNVGIQFKPQPVESPSSSESVQAASSTQGGFLVDVAVDTVGSFTSRLTSTDTSLKVIYKGDPNLIQSITLDTGSQTASNLSIQIIPQDIPYQQVFTLCEKLAQQLRIKQVTRAPGVEVGLELLRSIVNTVEQSAVTELSKARGARDRLRLMRRGMSPLKNLISELVRMNDVSKASSSIMASYIRGADSMKYGYQALNRATGASATDIIQDLTTLVSNEKQRLESNNTTTNNNSNQEQDKAISFISHESAPELLSQIMELQTILSENNGTMNEHELLQAFGMLGYGLKVFRTAASDVEPWQIQVTYLSVDRIATSDIICLLDSGTASVKDMSNHEITDAIVIVDPKFSVPYRSFVKTKLHEAYLGVVFARNPSIAIPAQASALLSLTLVRGVSQFKRARHRTKAHVKVVLDLMLQLNRKIGQDIPYWQGLVKKLYDSDPGMYLTTREGDDISTIAKILAAMCTIEASKDLFAPHNTAKLQRLAHDIMAQNIANGMKIRVKSMPNETVESSLVNMTKITKATVPVPLPDDQEEPRESTLFWSDEYDRDSVYNYCQNIVLNKKYGNCSVADIVMCLNFAKIVYTKIFPEILSSVKKEEETPDENIHRNEGFNKLREIFENGTEQQVDGILSVIQNELGKGEESVECGLLDFMKQYSLPVVSEKTELDSNFGVDKTYISALVIQCLVNHDSASRRGLAYSTKEQPEADQSQQATQADTQQQTKTQDKGKEKIEEDESNQSATTSESGAPASVKKEKKLIPQLDDLSTIENCEAYLKTIAQNVRKTMYRSECATKNARFAAARKAEADRIALEAEMKAQAEFMLTHSGNPEIWTQSMVTAHNAQNPDDLYSIARGPNGIQTGMLVDRCCFKTCPSYLKSQDLRTHFIPFGANRALGDVRRKWVKGYHWRCVLKWKENTAISKEEWVKVMGEIFKNSGDTCVETVGLEDIWETFNSEKVIEIGGNLFKQGDDTNTNNNNNSNVDVSSRADDHNKGLKNYDFYFKPQ